MEIEFDPVKRRWTLLQRGLDFSRAAEVFSGLHLTQQDCRRDYREARFISLRKANEREQALFAYRINGR